MKKQKPTLESILSEEETPAKLRLEVDSNTIDRIANRHLAIKYDCSLGKLASRVCLNDSTEKHLNQSNNFTFEDPKESIPSPEKRLVVQEEKPEPPQEVITERDHFYSGTAQMFESCESTDQDEEEPRDLSESLINLDTLTGQVELYEDQMSDSEHEDAPQMSNARDYMVLNQAEKSRRITLPKNNDKVNISAMLSRSFVGESNLNNSTMPDLDQSVFQTGCEDLNMSMNLAHNSPLQIKGKLLTPNVIVERQNEVLRMMEQEHMRICNSIRKLH